LGQLLWLAYRSHWPTGSDHIVLPVPLDPVRLRSRGFNQSCLLVNGWGKEGRDTAGQSPAVAWNLLRKSRPTTPQTGLSRARRLKNLRRSFTVAQPARIQGRNVLLVDDVYTTGATADTCSEVLLSHGAARVDILTVARTISRAELQEEDGPHDR
jgi:ComF family protein